MNRILKLFNTLGVQPLIGLPAAQEVDGNMMPAPGVITMGNALALAAANAGSVNFQTSAAATITITSLQNLVQRLTAGSACTVTLDSAYNIVAQIPNPFNGMTFPTTIMTNAGTTVATPTLSDTAVTLSGTTTVLAAGLRALQCKITQMSTTVGAGMTAGTTFTSLTQIGTTNNYTVALGTNVIVPVVGTAVLINVTAGTLPSGWYPINAESSATSFVIAAPPAGTAWTMTAGSLPGTTVVPASAYTPGLPGLYSPTMTITGMYGSVTAAFTV